MKKPMVGVDVDGVLCDLLTPCLEAANEMFGLKIQSDHLQEWNFDSLLPQDRLDEYWERVGEPGFIARCLPYPDAVEGFTELCKVADVYVVSAYLSNGKQWVHERDLWMKSHFDFPSKKMVHTKAKHTFGGHMLVDDKPANVIDWANESALGRTGVPVLWAQPYNLNYKPENEAERNVALRWVRTADWDTVLGIVTDRKW